MLPSVVSKQAKTPVTRLLTSFFPSFLIPLTVDIAPIPRELSHAGSLLLGPHVQVHRAYAGDMSAHLDQIVDIAE